jgi:2-oxoisovalerate dehydrogenase E1 component alpha subunit
MIVTNNEFGISTPAGTQHGEKHIADRAHAFEIECAIIDGNDPETAYRGLRDAMEYVRTQRKPFLLEAKVSRLHGHSSSSGGNYVESEPDCLTTFERTLQ